MTGFSAVRGARVFDGTHWHDEKALIFSDGSISGLMAPDTVPEGAAIVEADGLLVVPGFIDLQVNGGGGVLFNDQPNLDGIRTICAAHAKFGTTALLPTLITDTPDVTAQAIAAGHAAKAANVAGFLGLHLEGPHLSIARKGAHDPRLIRPMAQQDLEAILACKDAFDTIMVTVAAENVTPEQVSALSAAGIIVSLGHSDVSYKTAQAYVDAGVKTVTHLFNAMSPLGHREPGIVGAALEIGPLYAGLIADGFHVDPASMAIALRAKNGPGKIFIVTDAMSPLGTDVTSFTLNGREVLRQGGRLTLADGTLAGADIDMLSSVLFVHQELGLPLEEALRMASLYPAQAARVDGRKGSLRAGQDADFVLLTSDLELHSTWIGGQKAFQANV